MEQAEKNKNKIINCLLIIEFGLLILAAYFIIETVQLPDIPPLIKETIALATTRKPETFTELYFEDHINLPNKIIRDKVYRFSFTIHNLENTDTNYPYEVYIDVKGDKEFIDRGSVFVKNNEYITIDRSYMLTTPSGKVKIEVLLVDQNQSISFWLEK